MSISTRYSNDPKIKVLKLDKFFETYNYLINIPKSHFWTDKTKPSEFCDYIKFTPTLLIYISYGSYQINFGNDTREVLESIYVAFRDGKTEYTLIDNQIELLKQSQTQSPSIKIDSDIKKLVYIKSKLPKFLSGKKEPIIKSFEDNLIDTGYKTNIPSLMNNYVVFDVETNGIRKINDDLLSLSIYDPTSGICYHRYFPLSLQPLVLTTFINGITDNDLSNVTHLEQDELNKVIEYFDLKNKTLLSYSGGKGDFDIAFVINYCKRHNISGFENLHTYNIKWQLPSTLFGCEGQLSKDNICKLLQIDNVTKKHTGINDCILEWKLFEKLSKNYYLFLHEKMYRLNSNYIIPVTYLLQYRDISTYYNIKIPNLCGIPTELFRIDLPHKLIRSIEKFPTNITGVTIEHMINTMLNAQPQNNKDFLINNSKNLEYIGSLDNRIISIPIFFTANGLIKEVADEDKEIISQINKTSKKISSAIHPLIDYIQNNILTSDIKTQELVVSHDKKVFALCDLSDENHVIEIKTTNIFNNNNQLQDKIAKQLFFESNKRQTYVLHIDFDTYYEPTSGMIFTSKLSFVLYKIELIENNEINVIKTFNLSTTDTDVLKFIALNPNTTISNISNNLHLSKPCISKIIKTLIILKYIAKENPTSKKSKWLILRDINDTKNKYKFDGKSYVLLN